MAMQQEKKPKFVADVYSYDCNDWNLDVHWKQQNWELWNILPSNDRQEKSITERKKSTYTQQVSNRQHVAVKLLNTYWTDV